jgi:hypothetical protein
MTVVDGASRFSITVVLLWARAAVLISDATIVTTSFMLIPPWMLEM